MTKHRSVVTGWDPDHVNPDDSTGRPKGVQTAPDMRIATTYDILAEGIFAKYGVPTITGSPTNTATISPFQAAIASSLGGFYVITVDANEQFTINLANVGAVKIYAQQQDYETDNSKVDSNVVIGVVYGATAIPYNSLLLFTATITSETSTSGLTFTPAFKYTGAASGVVRVPTQADLANVAVLTTGIRALVTTTGGGGTKGEYFYGSDSAWHITTTSNPKIEQFVTDGWIPSGETWSYSSWNASTLIGVITVPSGATSRYSAGMRAKITQSTGGTKIGTITAVTSTTITVKFQYGYTLNNEAITGSYWTAAAAPQGAGFINRAQLGDSGALAPTFGANMSNSSFADVKIQKIGPIVSIRGAVQKSSTLNAGDLLLTLPAGYRPPLAATGDEADYTCPSSGSNTYKVKLLADGSVLCNSVRSDGGVGNYIFLNPIMFFAADS